MCVFHLFYFKNFSLFVQVLFIMVNKYLNFGSFRFREITLSMESVKLLMGKKILNAY